MTPGMAFEINLPDGDVYKVNYTIHFVNRFEIDEPEHQAVKRTVQEPLIREKLEEAIPKIDEVIYGQSLKGIIASKSQHFIMLFDAVETSYGRQLNMITMSRRVDFKSKSAKEVIIEVNPTFNVRFPAPLSYGLKLSILADITENWEVLVQGTTYHLGGEIMDYWLERGDQTFNILSADWSSDLTEIEVS
jgi:hypothetical protein